MCFPLYDGLREQVAHSNIMVSKFLDVERDMIISPHFYCIWYKKDKIDLRHKKVTSRFTIEEGEIHRGFSSYPTYCPYEDKINSTRIPFLFKIPTGTKYYVNISTGEIVSESLIFTGITDTYESLSIEKLYMYLEALGLLGE